MNKQYRDKHLIDATDPQEQDYQSRFSMRRDSDYEKFIDGLQPSPEQLDEMWRYYEHKRPF